MITYSKTGKKQISTDELARYFTKDYGFKVTPRDIHQICAHYGIDPYERGGISYFSDNRVRNMRETHEDFLDVLHNIVDFGDSRGQSAYNDIDNFEREDEMPEADMDYVSNELEKKYQTESVRTIQITEEQYKNLFEGVVWRKNDDGTIDLSVNSDMADSANTGSRSVDTRIFGKSNGILKGDGSKDGRSHSLERSALEGKALKQVYRNYIDFLSGNWYSDDFETIFNVENCPKKTKTTMRENYKKYLDGILSKEDLLYKANKNLGLNSFKNSQEEELYLRAKETADVGKSDKVAKYTKFIIPDTDVFCIGLYKMDSFDISDAIKKGGLRDSSQYFNTKNGGEAYDIKNYYVDKNGRVPVTYDGGLKKTVKDNFSLNGIDYDTDENGFIVPKGMHYKKNYKLQKTKDDIGDERSEKTYTSINQFLDKSIMYANYAIKKEGFRPDYIISAPSSSKMNEYYSFNLSNKMNVPYVKDFFVRDIVHAHFANGLTDEDLSKEGMSKKEIEEIKNEIRRYAYNEITYMVEKPLRNLIFSNEELFSNISIEKHGREKVSIENVYGQFSKYCFKLIREYLSDDNDVLGKYLCNEFLASKKIAYGTPRVYQNILPSIKNIIILKIGKKSFAKILSDMFNLLKYYSNEVRKGYTTRSYGKMDKSKITDIKKDHRKYVEGSFIIASKYLNKDYELLSKFKTSKFLIVDEDVNSGATFKLVIDAIKLKLPSMPSNNMLCLANGYSTKGR